jgi:hypothetical protein
MTTTQVEMKADLEERKAEMKINQEMLARMEARIEANKEKFKAIQGILVSQIDQEKREAATHCMRAWRKETTACQEETEAYPEKFEGNPEEIESEAEHEKVPKDAAVGTGRALNKRLRGRRLAAGRRGQPKERNRGNCGSPKKLAAARRGTTRRAGVARRKDQEESN